MKKYAVIVAGGTGTRMGEGIPKQFRTLCGRPVLWWSIKAFHDQDPETAIIVVLPKEFISLWNDFYATLPSTDRINHRVTSGGQSRGESVWNGLKLIEDEDSLVAVHDAARPLVSEKIINDGWETAKKTEAAIPVVPVTDSLRKITGDDSESVDRSLYVGVQTPQVFKTSLLKEAYRKAGDKVFTDDAAVVENLGHKISLFEGSHENMKITNPKDLGIASVIMGKDG